MSIASIPRWGLPAALLLAGGAGTALGQAASAACGGEAPCTEVREFAASVTGFRTSTVDASTKAVSLTLKFHNKGTGPLVLGYVPQSGVLTDDKGNRYTVSAVRGIGEIAGAQSDPKFSLAAGESSDARFELTIKLATPEQALGTRHDLELAVREMVVDGSQVRLGKEHALQLTGLGPSAAAAAPAEKDPCEGKSRCFAAEPFVAEVIRVTPVQAGRHHQVTFNLRIRNISGEPLILGYRSGSSSSVDNYGKPYHYGRAGTHDGSAKGIGLVTGRGADPQFALRPGQAREATFTVTRFEARPPVGTVFTFSVALEQLEILPPDGIRTLNQYAVTFADLTAGGTALDGARKLLDAVRKP